MAIIAPSKFVNQNSSGSPEDYVAAVAITKPAAGGASVINPAQEDGNLASVKTNTDTVVTALGTDGTGITQPTGGAGVRGWLSGIYNTLLSRLPTLVSGRTPVDGSGVTQPVSAASLPLPTGAATETTLAAMNTKIPSSPATDRTTAASPASVRLSDGTAFWKGTTPSDTQPISASSLPLPTGAATAANQTTGNTSLANIDTDLGAQADSVATSNTGTFSLIALIKRLLNRLPSFTVASVSIGTATSSATGATFVTLASATGTYLSVSNITGTTLEYRRGGAGNTFPIYPNTYYTILLPTGNANDISFRRTDQNNAQVTFTYEVVTQ